MSEYRDMLLDPAYEDTNLIVRLPLEWVLQNIVWSCDFDRMTDEDSLLAMVRYKAADSGFGHLLDSIMKRGFIRESPIGLRWMDGDDYYCNFEKGLYLSEGHHRLTAAILLCEDYIWASAYGRGADVNGHRISGHYSANAYPIELD